MVCEEKTVLCLDAPCMLGANPRSLSQRDLFILGLTALQDEKETNELSYFQLMGASLIT